MVLLFRLGPPKVPLQKIGYFVDLFFVRLTTLAKQFQRLYCPLCFLLKNLLMIPAAKFIFFDFQLDNTLYFLLTEILLGLLQYVQKLGDKVLSFLFILDNFLWSRPQHDSITIIVFKCYQDIQLFSLSSHQMLQGDRKTSIDTEGLISAVSNSQLKLYLGSHFHISNVLKLFFTFHTKNQL